VHIKVLIFILLLSTYGCDQFPGPTIRSEFKSDIKMTVKYSNGESFDHFWKPCDTVFIGATEIGKFGLKKNDVSVENIKIELQGNIIHDYGRSDIDELLIQESSQNGYVVWVMDMNGIKLSKSSECFKGE